MIVLLTGQYTFVVHNNMYVLFPSYVLDSTGSVRFRVAFSLPPLLIVLACQGDFNEDHFRCQQQHCGRSPAVSLTGRVLFALWQPLSFTSPIMIVLFMIYYW